MLIPGVKIYKSLPFQLTWGHCKHPGCQLTNFGTGKIVAAGSRRQRNWKKTSPWYQLATKSLAKSGWMKRGGWWRMRRRRCCRNCDARIVGLCPNWRGRSILPAAALQQLHFHSKWAAGVSGFSQKMCQIWGKSPADLALLIRLGAFFREWMNLRRREKWE